MNYQEAFFDELEKIGGWRKDLLQKLRRLKAKKTSLSKTEKGVLGKAVMKAIKGGDYGKQSYAEMMGRASTKPDLLTRILPKRPWGVY